ncbi:hypothetical protein [Paraburkholderia sediminicola]|uniref:hypothetical protein n=1 Tax=Paraburkholderia sediminicola TaxID=458836 RepID=UPI0038BDC09E
MNERFSGVRTLDWSKVVKSFNWSYLPVTAAMSAEEQRTKIARNYATLADELEYNREDWSRIDPYQIADWAGILTSPEFGAWQDIRSSGLPLWPRLPVGNFIVSFGNPAAKVALQCGIEYDGIAASELHADHWLKQIGWRVFRASAEQCTRVMESPADVRERTGEVSEEYRARYLTETLEGTIHDLRHALIAAGALR